MKKLLQLGITLFAFSGFSQSNELKITPSFNAIIVNDLELSKEWYCKLFKLNVLTEFASEERGFKIANLGNEQLNLELLELKGSVNPQEANQDFNEKTRFKGFFKSGFSVNDFDRLEELLQEHQIEGNVVRDPSTQKRMVIIRDPDGNRIQFFEQ